MEGAAESECKVSIFEFPWRSFYGLQVCISVCNLALNALMHILIFIFKWLDSGSSRYYCQEMLSSEYLHVGTDCQTNDIQELHKRICTRTTTYLEQIPVFGVGIRRPAALHNGWSRMSFLMTRRRLLLRVITNRNLWCWVRLSLSTEDASSVDVTE